MQKRLYRQILWLITFFLLGIAVLWRLDVLFNALNILIKTLVPLFMGVGVAFILNMPFNYIAFFVKKISLNKLKEKYVNIIALVLTYLIFFGVLVGIFACLIPQLIKSVETLYYNLSNYSQNIGDFFDKIYNRLQLKNFEKNDLAQIFESVSTLVANLSKGFFPRVFKATGSFFATIINLGIGFALSFYILCDKGHLKKQVTGFIRAWLPHKMAEKTIKIGSLTQKTFQKFITGQLTEVFILTVLCFIGMEIFRFKYPLLISIIIGITNIIPVVGPFLGTVPCAFILFMENPISAVWFIVFIIILQQIECNLIYPHVVGGHIGLPALWVAVGVFVGGSLFGLWGMLLSLPTVSVVYTLVREATKKRLAIKVKKTSANPIVKFRNNTLH